MGDNESSEEANEILPLMWNEKIDDLLIEWCDIARC